MLVKITEIILLVLVLLSTAISPVALAQSDSGLSLSIQAGLDGYSKDSRWVPVRVTVENNGQDLKGYLQVETTGYNNQKSIFSQEISLPSVSRKEVFLYVYPQASRSEVKVELISGNQKLAEAADRITVLGPTDILYGVLAAENSPYTILSQLKPANGNAMVAFLNPADLPDQFQGLSALDTLVISGIGTGFLSKEQLQAIQVWIAGGGRLLVTGGPAWKEVSAGLDSLLALIPDKETNLADLSALAVYFPDETGPEGEAVVAAGQLAEDAQVMAQQGEFPLVVRKPYGSGETIFLAVDPALAPLKGWAGWESLLRALVSGSGGRKDLAGSFQNWDMAHDAAATLANLGLPGGWLIACFLGLYILAVGPLNYLVLRRFKRRELAWLTIPILVLLFSGLAFTAGSRALGSLPILNRLAIVKSWPGVEQSQVEALIGVFSPRRDRLTLQAAPPFLAHSIASTRVQSQDSGNTFRRDELHNLLIPDLRLDIGGIRTVALQGQIPALDIQGELTAILRVDDPMIQGSATNKSGRRFEDAVLLMPSGPLRLEEIEPGETKEVEAIIPAEAHALPTQSNPSGPYGYRPYGIAPSLSDDLMGSVGNYRNQDYYRRYALLSATADPGYAPGERGSGFTLAGWSQELPFEVGLNSGNFQSSDTVLYLIGLNPKFVWEGETAQLPPALFTWTVLEQGQSGNASPYDAWIDMDGFSLQFRLAHSIPFRSVERLTLHLTSTASGAAGKATLALWDYSQNEWENLGPMDWGDHELPTPERYVGPGGEVRMRIAAEGTLGTIQIGRADFTLTVGK